MAIPAVIDSAQGGRTDAGTISVPLPSGQSWLAVVSSFGPAITPPSGWTLVPGTQNTVSSENRTACYHANTADSPGTDWSVGSGVTTCRVLVVGLDQETTPDEASHTTTMTSPSITASGAVLVCRLHTNGAWDAEPPTVDYPDGTAHGMQGYTFSGDVVLGGSLVAYADSDQGASGATGTAGWSMATGQDFTPVSHTVALFSSGVEQIDGVGVLEASAGQVDGQATVIAVVAASLAAPAGDLAATGSTDVTHQWWTGLAIQDPRTLTPLPDPAVLVVIPDRHTLIALED